MADAKKCLKLITYFIIVLSVASPDILSAKTSSLNVQPSSGLPPLEVKITCYADISTSRPVSYKINYGDGSPEEIVESNQYSYVFTHTYQSGFFLPKVFIEKEIGTTSESDPFHLIVAKWKFETNGEIDSSPAVGPDGTVYVGSDDGNLYAVDPETGLEKWRFSTGGEIQSSPAVGPDGTIFFGSVDNTFYAVKPNGTLKWSYNIGNFVFSSPAIGSEGRVVFVGASDNNVYAFNASSGTLKWKVTTDGKIVSSPAVGYDGLENVVYVGSLDRHVYALSANNGRLKWKFNTNTEVYGSPAVGPNGNIYVGECRIGDALSYNYKLFCLNVDGSKFWEFDGGTGFYSSPSIGPEGIIYIGSWDGTFYAIKADGNKLWSVQTNPPRSINSSPAVGFSGRYPVLYVGAKDGNFYAFQSPEVEEGIDQRQDWIFETGDDILYSSPAIDQNGTLYIGSHDKCLYAIQPGNMNPAESPWPMFHKSADRWGAAQNIEIPSIISASPSPNFNDIDINTNEIIVNFSPDIKTTQVRIDSFELKKEGDNAALIEGLALLKSKRYNNSGYHVVAIFTPDDKELPLDYNAKYTASIRYIPAAQNNGESAENEPVEETSYSWSFTTEIEPEKDPNPSPESDWSCFIDSLRPRGEPL
jgi:outer membrane protein assembly factor BamB